MASRAAARTSPSSPAAARARRRLRAACARRDGEKALAALPLGVFAALACDAAALHALQPLDDAVARWSYGALDDAQRAWFGAVASNVCIDGALLSALLLAPALSGTARGRRALRVAGASHVLLGGFVPHGLPQPPAQLLVGAIKVAIGRPRPPTGAALYSGAALGQGYAFPSGHTTCAVFTVGTLLFVLAPAAEEAWRERGDARLAELATAAHGAALPLTAGAGALTAASRVAANVHWLTDVTAGGCLGTAIVILEMALLERAAQEEAHTDERQG